MLWTDGHSSSSIVLDPPDREAIVASACIATAVNVIDVAVVWIYRCVIHTAKKSVHGPELGSWLGAVAISNDDTTGHSIQSPGGSAICGAI
jgi:hypothetical protein